MMKEIYQRGPIACGIDAGPLLKLGQVISDIIGFREPPKYVQKRHVDLIALPSLKLTDNAPENGWLEDEMSYWEGLFSWDMLVSQRVTLYELSLVSS